jgi:hypothetical protein
MLVSGRIDSSVFDKAEWTLPQFNFDEVGPLSGQRCAVAAPLRLR